MTRAEDVAMAVSLGIQYVGVIFAGGPRNQSVPRANGVLSRAHGVRRVGVVGDQTIEEVANLVETLSLDVVQLHADPSPARVRDVGAATGARTWAVVRIAGTVLPPSFGELARTADAIVLDARAPGGLGGTGVTLPWRELAAALEPWRGEVEIVLAGGLRSENVGEAIAAIEPDVVDVSSGIEAAPGIKDHVRMRAFRDAVQRAGVSDGR